MTDIDNFATPDSDDSGILDNIDNLDATPLYESEPMSNIDAIHVQNIDIDGVDYLDDGSDDGE